MRRLVAEQEEAICVFECVSTSFCISVYKLRKGHVKTQEIGLQVRKRALTENQSSQHFDIGVLSLQNYEK